MYNPAVMHNHPISEKSQHLMRAATVAAVSLAGGLIVLKALAWFFTGSVSLLSSLVDSVMDVMVSMINLVAVRYAMKPPDDDHRFGHYSAEDVASVLQAAFITGSAVMVIIEAVARLLSPTSIEHGWVGITVMVVSMVSTMALVKFQRHTSKTTGSTAIEADSLHYSTDIAHNIGVIVALICSSYFGWHFIDPLIAFAIAAYMIHGAYEIGYAAFNRLLDKEFPLNEQREVENIISSHSGIHGFHGLKTRRSGMQSYIQCHLEMDGTMDITSAKAIDREIKAALREKFQSAEIIFQYDPVVNNKT